MLSLLIALYALFYIFLAFRNFRVALFILVFSLPAYLIRFNFGPFPTTLLELNFGIIFLVWLIKYAGSDWTKIKQIILAKKIFFIFLLLFFLASILGIFISDMWYYSFGQWRAYFLEPILFFFLLIGHLTTVATTRVPGAQPGPEEKRPGQAITLLISALLASTVPLSIVALIQSSTGLLYPPSLWDDIVRGRAVGYFTSPNALALYLVPILLLSLSLAIYYQKSGEQKYFNLISSSLTLGILALLASQSYGGIIAFCLSALIWLFLTAQNQKRIIQGAVAAFAALIVTSALAFTLPHFRTSLANKIRSGNNRLVLWTHTVNFLSASPKNFIFGAGIRQYFRKIEKPLYNPVELERLIYPHNIIFNFWSEIGLLGAISFLLLFIFLLKYSWREASKKNIFAAALLAALVAIFIHGLIDVPYFKNDLAFLFWIIASLTIALPTQSRAAVAQTASGERINPAESDSVPAK